jgi:regulator of replication initiation timing/nucleoside 2-deoxyribosyltransferase
MSQDKKYQVFISSTYEDLVEERRQATNAVLKLHQIPVGMELFNAGNSTQWEEIQRQIDISDYYIVIVGNIYGSEDDKGISYTEKEYRYAVEKGIPVIGFVISDKAKQEKTKVDTVKKKVDKLNKFKGLVKSKMVEFWVDGTDLNSKVATALAVEMTKNPQRGWIKSDNVDYKNISDQLASLIEENKILKVELDKIKNNEENSLQSIINSLKEKKVELIYGIKYYNNKSFSLAEILVLIYESIFVPKTAYDINRILAEKTLEIKTNSFKIQQIRDVLYDYNILGIVHPQVYGNAAEGWVLTDLGRKVAIFLSRNETA